MRFRAPSHIAALAAALLACAGSPARPPSPHVGEVLELAAADLTGAPVDVAADGGKVRVVDFWASWCEPCRDSLPKLDAMRRELGPRGLSVYAVSLDEDRESLDAFLRDVPLGMPVLWDKGGDRLSSRYDVKRLPTTFIVDRRGVIRWAYSGWSAKRAGEARREVERLLDEPR
jgi:thiol-disulfide isomerase/thioredoxin